MDADDVLLTVTITIGAAGVLALLVFWVRYRKDRRG